MSSLFKAGDKIGKYRVVDLIGHGGMASVYLGVDEDLERNVAIKVLHPHLEGRGEAKERFRREAKAIAKISHPNIVEIYDYSGEDARQSFIVTQLVSGGNLKEIKEKWGECLPEIVAAIGVQVAEGLAFAHSCGVVHRDIKPENLLLDRDGTVKIADFGIAHLADSHDMTATGQILGSPYYMSPEQVTGGRVDERSDIFSFGSFLFWLATGKQAFEGANPHAILRSIVEKEVDEAERLSPAMGRRLGAVIQKCMQKSPDERYPSFAPAVADLRDYLDLSGVESVQEEIRGFDADPDGYRARRRDKSIRVWTEKAAAAEREGKVGDAMDLFNRVLALDPENAVVLGKIREARSASAHRRAIKWAVGAVFLATLLVGGFVLGKTLFSERPGITAKTAQGGKSLFTPAWKGGEGGPSAPGPGAAAGAGADGAQGGKKDEAGAKGKVRGLVPGAALKKAAADHEAGKTRKVRFVPFPKTVTIFVDGKLVGNYFSAQEMELAVGEHRFRFEPLDPECCDPAEWTANVVSAATDGKPQIIGKRLSLHPASLVVSSDRAADVLLSGKKVGRTGEEISVPLGDDPQKIVEVSISSPGCDLWSATDKLKAGKTLRLKAKLTCK